MSAPTYRYLVNLPEIHAGRTIIEGTLIGVHEVIALLLSGQTVNTLITRYFPDLTRAQVYECLAYYGDNRGEIDLLVAEQAKS